MGNPSLLAGLDQIGKLNNNNKTFQYGSDKSFSERCQGNYLAVSRCSREFKLKVEVPLFAELLCDTL